MTADDEIIDQDVIYLLAFLNDWCDHCQTMEPIIDAIKVELGEKIDITIIDIEKLPKLAVAYNIRTTPSFVILKNGKIWWQYSGMLTKREIMQEINKLI